MGDAIMCDPILFNMADDINHFTVCGEVGEYFRQTAGTFREDNYHLTVLLLGMCINRELSIRIAEEQDTDVKAFPEKLEQIYQTLLDKYREYHRFVTEKMEQTEETLFFLSYLDDMTERLLAGIKYIKKSPDEPWYQCDQDNEWNTQYRREERIRDRMKYMINKNEKFTQFTIQHRIQLPYMYVLAWDLPNMLNKYNDRKKEVDEYEASYTGLLPGNVRTALHFLDDNMLDILLYGFQVDNSRFEDTEEDNSIRFYKKVSYEGLLPTFIEVEQRSSFLIDDLADRKEWASARKTHIRPHIKKEILSKKPLLPMEIDKRKCSIRLLRMMIDVLKEENKTRELNTQLEKKNSALKKLNAEKVDMMDYYAHSWKHISYPKIVKDVAEALLGRDDDASVTMANKLLRAYNSEQTLKHGIQLLQYSISEDREKVKKEFKKGFLVIGAPKEDGIVGIDRILYESLDMVILKLMMDDIDTSRRMKKCRSKIENIEELREEYTELFLKNTEQKNKLLKWVNEKLFPLSFEINEEWEAVRLDKESFAAAQMTEVFVELLTNVLLHGEGYAGFTLCSGADSMDIRGTNGCSDARERKGGKGIWTLENVINKINFESGIEDGIVCHKIEGEYSICIRLDKKIVYKG